MKHPKYKHKPAATAKFAVEYARAANGTYPAEEFLAGVDRKTRSKLDVLIERFHQEGKIYNTKQFKMLHGGIDFFEFKHYQTRIIGYYAPRQGAIVLTHGFTKKTDETPPSEITRAARYKEEYEGMMKDAQQGSKPRR